MPSALRGERVRSAKLRIPRKKPPKRAELVAQQVPGLDNQSLDKTGGRLLLGEGNLLGGHGLQDLQSGSPFGELTVYDLARKIEEAFVAQDRPGGVLRQSPADAIASPRRTGAKSPSKLANMPG